MTAHDPDRPVPSDAAVRRLRCALTAEVDAYRRELDTDLDDVARATATDREDLAVEVLRDHLARLEQVSSDLKRVVAGAVVEREAEAVLDGVQPSLSRGPELSPAAPPPGVPPVAVPPPPSASTPRRGPRAGLAVALGLALCGLVVAGQLVAPDHDPRLAGAAVTAPAATSSPAAPVEAPTTAPTTAPTAASSATEAALAARRALEELDAAALARPGVRAEVEALLDQQRAVLEPLALQDPEARALLADLRRIAIRLGIVLEELPVDLPAASAAGRGPATDRPPVTDGSPVTDGPTTAGPAPAPAPAATTSPHPAPAATGTAHGPAVTPDPLEDLLDRPEGSAGTGDASGLAPLVSP